MPVKMQPTSTIKARLGLEPNGRVQKFFTHTCRIRMNKYVPFDTGTLATTVEEKPKQVIYDQPYAKIVYYGLRNGKPINYHKDKHPLASPYWDKQMVSAEMDSIVQEVQDFIGGK